MDAIAPYAITSTTGQNKTPLVLLHGLQGRLDALPVLRQLQAFDVLAPTLLGYGEHDCAQPHQINLMAQARHMASLAHRYFDGRPFHLAGHAAGGVIAAMMASAYPQQVLSLTSIEGHFTPRDDPTRWLHDARNNDGYRLQPPAGFLHVMHRALLAATADPAYTGQLQQVFERIPVALLAGARSYKYWDLPPWADRLAQELTLMDNAGHLMMLDDAGKFGAVLGDIIDRQILRVLEQQEKLLHAVAMNMADR